MEGKIIHGGHPVLRWMAGNVVVDTDPAGNIKVTKAKSKEKIDGIVAAIMALDRCIRNQTEPQGSVYDERGLLVFLNGGFKNDGWWRLSSLLAVYFCFLLTKS